MPSHLPSLKHPSPGLNRDDSKSSPGLEGSKLHPAFTLIELLVVMFIIGVLVSVGYINFLNTQQKGRDARRKQDLKTISTALLSYYQDKDAYPPLCSTPPCAEITLPSGPPLWISQLVPSYLKTLPQDPKGQNTQNYTLVVAADRLSFELWAQLENSNDREMVGQPESKCTKTPPDPKYNYCLESPK